MSRDQDFISECLKYLGRIVKYLITFVSFQLQIKVYWMQMIIYNICLELKMLLPNMEVELFLMNSKGTLEKLLIFF